MDLIAKNGDENGVKKRKKRQKRCATRGLPRRSPILVLLSPNHASMRSSDGIQCISAGMIAPVKYCKINVDMSLALGLSFKTW